ncbi:MAG: hypothetical protein FJ279_19375 [Planctomycetes bacterium]|nr:hypothetical protein [Planctomycetota bacterium]
MLFPSVTPSEIETLHRNTLRVMSEVGMAVENEHILDRLASLGGEVDKRRQIVRFAPSVVEKLLAESECFDWTKVTPVVTASAGIYVGRYLDPETGRYEKWTVERILHYAKVARHLEHVGQAGMLGCPLDGVPHTIHPLYQRYLCWKHGIGSGGSLWELALCPYILEMSQIMADAEGKRLADYFGGTVYPQTPLKFGKTEAEQFVFFADRGLRVGIGHMMSAGGTGPATLAGALTVWLAETLFINFIQRAFFGTRGLHFHCSITALDMKSGMYPYGRPERPLTNVIMAHLARHYGASFTGHGGHTDAKAPSPEAGAQKALTCIPILMAGGRCHVSAGLLSVDEIFSPIQMILDNEFAGALKRFARGCVISDETCAVDVIKQVGPGGNFLDTDHTAAVYRAEHWQPALWSREMWARWWDGDRKTDVERARDIYHLIKSQPDLPPQISDETEKALLGVIERAKAR